MILYLGGPVLRAKWRLGIWRANCLSGTAGDTVFSKSCFIWKTPWEKSLRMGASVGQSYVERLWPIRTANHTQSGPAWSQKCQPTGEIYRRGPGVSTLTLVENQSLLMLQCLSKVLGGSRRCVFFQFLFHIWFFFLAWYFLYLFLIWKT